jgi:hypothetical protein
VGNAARRQAGADSCCDEGSGGLFTLCGVGDPLEHETVAGDTEEVDALLVEAEDELIVRRAAPVAAPSRAIVPAVQAVAVAATGFVAGAAVVGLVGRHQRRALAQGSGAGRALGRGRGGRDRGPEVLQVVSTRSLLVDVHVLGGPGDQR